MGDTTAMNRQILLVETPKGKLEPSHFRQAESAVPVARSDGEVLLRVKIVSLDAANRAWMQGATYRSAVTAGTVMAGGGVAEVVESKAPGFAKGDLVFADTGWQDFAVLPAKALSKLPKVEPLTHLISVFGIAGLTAYFGLLESASRRRARRSSSRRRPAPSARSSARSPRSRAAASSASRADRPNATG